MLDVVNFEVNGGVGGNGAVSFRREKFIPRGGPDGGDGGRGGDIVFIAADNMSTLQEYSNTRIIQATNGVKGITKQRHGATGNDVMLYVPTGSIVWGIVSGSHQVGVPIKDVAECGERLADLDEDGMVFIAARGGRGGRGNKRFAKSTRQTPMFAQKGMIGQQRHLQIELKLLADVGLVGLPNAGKSTLLSMWSQAHPKIGAYEFTTLEPNLGVVYLGYDSFVAADMPGLIEGASQGVGLGHEFLRHIERTKVLIHLVDMSREDPVHDIRIIQGELASSGHNLDEKPVILALNKIDNPDAGAQVELLEHEIRAEFGEFYQISGQNGEGLSTLANKALEQVRLNTKPLTESIPVLKPKVTETRRFSVSSYGEGMTILAGETPEWWALTLDLQQEEARAEFFDRMKRLGVERALRKAGVTDGNKVKIRDLIVVWDM